MKNKLSTAAPTTLTERPFLQIEDATSGRHFLEIALGSGDVSFSVAQVDENDEIRVQVVQISAADFNALVERLRAHTFDAK